MIRPLSWTLLTILVGLHTAPVRAAGEFSSEQFLTPAAEQAIERGLEFLVKQQRKDGSFPSGSHIVGPTGIAILAFLANGHLPRKGPYGPAISKAVEFLLKTQDASGIWSQDMGVYMYGHGYALLALADVWGEYPDPQGRLQEAIERAVDVALAANKINAQGGWRYNPTDRDSDTSVTSSVLQGVRAAREAFFDVPQLTMDRVATYLVSNATPEGGFGYQGRDGANLARTGIGVLGLMACGQSSRPQVLKGVEWIRRRPQLAEFPSYSAYYSVLAMYQARTLVGEKAWSEWYPKIQNQILKSQQRDGSFVGNTAGPVVDTGLMVIALSVQKGLLPLFQR